MQAQKVNTDKQKQEEFMQLYKPLNARLSRFCEAIAHNNDDARDLMSDTVLAAYENFEKLRNKEAFLSYLFGTASRIFKSKSRRKKWWGIFDQSRAEEVSGSHSDAEMSTELTMLYTALNKLPEEQRVALVLFEVSGFTIKEICEAQSSTESAVKSRISRARQRLVELTGEKKITPTSMRMVSMVLNSLFF